jgi:predicted metal-dependent phosphoesterase TrpH
MSVLSGMMQKLVEANARVAQNQEEYTKQYNDMVRQYDEAKAQFNEVVDTITAKGKQKARLGAFISALKKQEGIIDEFTPDLWGSMVDFITVGRKKEIKVTFRDGTEIMA